MEREVSLNEISDGKLYELNDMVKADCNDCKDCHACCCGMGSSITLDPLDIYQLTQGLNCSFEALLTERIELNVVDGVILPNIKMAGEQEKCSFLNAEGRCTVHGFRPGICRLFPLGRFYENNSFKYFLQVHECKNNNRTKVKVKKWIDTPQLKENEQFINTWHYFIKDVQEFVKNSTDDATVKNINMYILNLFYMTPYAADIDFYTQFEERMNKIVGIIGI